jgi:hypothetical protein
VNVKDREHRAPDHDRTPKDDRHEDPESDIPERMSARRAPCRRRGRFYDARGRAAARSLRQQPDKKTILEGGAVGAAIGAAGQVEAERGAIG